MDCMNHMNAFWRPHTKIGLKGKNGTWEVDDTVGMCLGICGEANGVSQSTTLPEPCRHLTVTRIALGYFSAGEPA